MFAVSFLVEVTVRVTGLLLAALLLALLLRRAPAATRRKLWAATVGALLLLPALVTALPRLPVPVLTPPRPPAWSLVQQEPLGPTTQAGVLAPVPAPPVRPSRSWRELVIALYAAGVLVSLGGLVRARRRVNRSLRGARPAGTEWEVPAGVNARESEEVSLPSTVGALRPVVLLPQAGRSWPPAWRRAVLSHEAAHVDARDGLAQLGAELARCLYWFHPLVHLAARQLRVERELAADDRTLAATGMAPSAYAGLLFELACLPESPAQLGAVVPLLTPAGLKARLLSILDGKRARAEKRMAVVALAAVGLVALTSAAAAIPSNRRFGHGRGPVVARVTGVAPLSGVEVVFSVPTRPMPFTSVFSEARGEVRYPADLQEAPYYNLYARRGRLAARHEVNAVPYGTQLPVELALHQGLVLSGRIVDDQQAPVEDATVEILVQEIYTPGPAQQVLAHSDREGRWRAEGILYGRFTLLVRAPWGVFTTVEADLSDRDLVAVNAVVPRRWPVTGYLRDDAGRPVGGVRVNQSNIWVAWGGLPISKYPILGERYVDWDESEPDGSYRLLPRPGRLTVTNRAADGGWRFGENDRVAAPPHIITLRHTVRLGGVVRGADGRGVPGALVTAVETAWSFPQNAGESAVTGPDGRFVLPVVPPRRVTIWVNREGHRLSPPTAQVTVALQPGESPRDLEIRLP